MDRKAVAPALAKIRRSKIGKRSKEKGSAFERLTGAMLSQWLTGGERKDLFSRNVLSGGRFTNSVRNKTALGVPGDLMAAHPLAFNFLSHFLVECKHYKELSIHAYLMDNKQKSFIGSVIKQTAAQADQVGLSWMLIAKQNALPTLIFMPMPAGRLASEQQGACGFTYHLLHNQSIWMARLEDFLLYNDATDYLLRFSNHKAATDDTADR